MNWLYIAVMGYIVFSAVRGYHKGVLRVAYSLAALLITVVFVAAVSPAVKNVLTEQTPVAQQIGTISEEFIRNQTEQKIEDGTFTKSKGLPWSMLPESVRDELGGGTEKVIKEVLESQKIYQKLGKAVADYCISAIAFTVTLAAIQIFLFLFRKKLNLFAKLPGINIANMILGFCAGVLKAFFVIWIVFALIKASEILPVSAGLIEMIEENAVLTGLYEQNPILEGMRKMNLL